MTRDEPIDRIAEHVADAENAEQRCRWSVGPYRIEGLVTRDGTTAVRRAVNSAYDAAALRRSRVHVATSDCVWDALPRPKG